VNGEDQQAAKKCVLPSTFAALAVNGEDQQATKKCVLPSTFAANAVNAGDQQAPKKYALRPPSPSVRTYCLSRRGT
jgi:hypothetical protein